MRLFETQARHAFELRNQFRSDARELMADRDLANQLYASEPNLTFNQVFNKSRNNLIENGVPNPILDQIHNGIIKSSQRSRASVNISLGLQAPE